MISNKWPVVLFVDIDGLLIVENNAGASKQLNATAEINPGVVDKFDEWNSKAYKIILTTGRPESHRQVTEDLLRGLGLFWDQLIMGLGPGQRVVINDLKPKSPEIPMAIAINIPRNKGFEDFSLEAYAEKQTTIIS